MKTDVLMAMGPGDDERQQLHEFVAGQPAPAVDDLRFDERDHGVAAAEGEESDLEKRAEKCG